MRLALAILAFVLLPASALAAKLPLDDGDYKQGQCAAGSSDILQSFDIQTVMEGRQKGSRLLYPDAEGQQGACVTGTIRVSGTIFSGSAECTDGGSRIQYSTGTYHGPELRLTTIPDACDL